MILDSLDNSRRYFLLHPRFEQAFTFLAQNMDSLAEGVHEIQGRELYITVVDTPLREASMAPLEVHDDYIDIQVVVQGDESFGYKPREKCTKPKAEMDKERDILFFEDTFSTTIQAHQGQFLIFWPTDAHAPLIGEGSVKKAIIKVKQ